MKAYFLITGIAAVLFILIVVAAVICISSMIVEASRQDRVETEERATREVLIEEIRELQLQIRRLDYGVARTKTEEESEEAKHTQVDDRGNHVSHFRFGNRDDENV